MKAIDLLLNRQSCPRLQAPGPNEAQLAALLSAGARVPDHGNLSPWEFIVAEGEGLNKLANIYVTAAKAKGVSEELIAKAEKMPHRAPMVITVVAKYHEHPKVPLLEQQLAAGCATMAMQQAAYALGLGAIWRTGDFAFSPDVHKALSLGEQDQIVGFLYIGTPVVSAPVKTPKNIDNFVRYL